MFTEVFVQPHKHVSHRLCERRSTDLINENILQVAQVCKTSQSVFQRLHDETVSCFYVCSSLGFQSVKYYNQLSLLCRRHSARYKSLQALSACTLNKSLIGRACSQTHTHTHTPPWWRRPLCSGWRGSRTRSSDVSALWPEGWLVPSSSHPTPRRYARSATHTPGEHTHRINTHSAEFSRFRELGAHEVR